MSWKLRLSDDLPITGTREMDEENGSVSTQGLEKEARQIESARWEKVVATTRSM